MPHKLRKIRKKRGSRTCGYGRVGQHRKSSSKSRRKVGRHKHGWSYVVKYEPDYFRRIGFTSPKSLIRRVNTINVGELEEIIYKVSPGRRKGKPLIDLTSMGYDKLLGKGEITRPVVVKVQSYSRRALEKIEKAGGEIIAG
ncbi:50S ribosomal protein L15 [Candidatus Bathyarchaeota archaeon]|nr:MAG: 50S ribosomal protein L15 [Candidatus Bathyarchaeota archaeon]